MVPSMFRFGRSKNLLISPKPWIIAHGPRAKNEKLCPNQILDFPTHYLKGLFLSFQNITKSLNRTKVMTFRTKLHMNHFRKNDMWDLSQLTTPSAEPVAITGRSLLMVRQRNGEATVGEGVVKQ